MLRSKRTKLKGGDEVDSVRGKHLHTWKPGERKKLKRKINKRVRKIAKTEQHYQAFCDQPIGINRKQLRDLLDEDLWTL